MERQQVVVSHFLRIAHFIVFDLIEIDALSEFVRLAEGDDRHLVLTRDVSDH